MSFNIRTPGMMHEYSYIKTLYLASVDMDRSAISNFTELQPEWPWGSEAPATRGHSPLSSVDFRSMSSICEMPRLGESRLGPDH